MVKLFKFQDKALSELQEYSSILIKSNKKNKYILFEAITGSGKTIIMTSYVQRMFQEYDNLAFIWISIGNGNLHIQNAKKIDRYTSSDINVIYFGTEDEDEKTSKKEITMDRLNPKDILVLNWESINRTDKGKFTNILMRDGEKRNLFELLDSTRNSGTKTILIIDESHHTAQSDISREIINRFKPEFIIEVTATPKNRIPSQKDSKDKRAFYIKVDEDDVIKEGVIKKRILANKGFKQSNYKSIIENIVDLAFEKHSELYKAYEYKINPLILIQIPNKTEGDILKEELKNILDKRGVNRDNKNLAVWLNDDKAHLSPDIDKWDSDIKCLIFKEAVATGWDCPRAQILIKLREIKSETFNIQVIGRILRMPELKHYNNEILNYAYIYTNEENVVVEGDIYADKIITERVYIKDEFEEFYKDNFTTYNIKRSYMNPTEEQVYIKFKKAMNLIDFENFIWTDDIRLRIQSDEQYEIAELKPKLRDDNEAQHKTDILVANDEDLNLLWRSNINRTAINKKMSLGDIIISYIIERYKKENREFAYKEVYKTFIVKELKDKFFTEIFDKIFDELRKEDIAEVSEGIFTIPFYRDYNSKEIKRLIDRFDKCIYNRHKESEHNTEKIFEEFIDKNKNVLFWFKNKDKGKDGLSVPYKYEGKNSLFYPDYIIKFKDESIGIYEVKSVNDQEEQKTDKKILRLMKYIQNNGYKGGLIKVDSTRNFISNKEYFKEFNI